jgi:hypothetical protein
VLLPAYSIRFADQRSQRGINIVWMAQPKTVAKGPRAIDFHLVKFWGATRRVSHKEKHSQFFRVITLPNLTLTINTIRVFWA